MAKIYKIFKNFDPIYHFAARFKNVFVLIDGTLIILKKKKLSKSIQVCSTFIDLDLATNTLSNIFYCSF